MATRKTIRQQLIAAVEAEYGELAQLYSNHKPTKPDGQSPIVAVEVASGEYTLRGSGASGYLADQELVINLLHIVLGKYGTGWTRENADDATDDLFDAFLSFLQNNQETDYWQSIYQPGATVIRDDVEIGGELYVIETIPLVIQAK